MTRTFYRLTGTAGSRVRTAQADSPYAALCIRNRWEAGGYTVTITEGQTGMGRTVRPVQ